MKNIAMIAGLAVVLTLAAPPDQTQRMARGAEAERASSAFQAGFGKRDITPPPGIPMWGYGARHNALAQGVLDPLFAKAIVIHAGNDKLALVGLDLGRGPTLAMMEEIRHAVSEGAKINTVMISGSHTHHGPVIELTDQPGAGKGRYDRAVAYNKKLPKLIVEAILEADKNARPARLGVTSRSDLALNRNRQMKHEPKVTDPMLAVMRFDDESGAPIAVLVNFAAHPVMTDNRLLKFSADYPGFMMGRVESSLQTNCVFMQGAAGDMSVNPGMYGSPQRFGEHLGDLVVGLAKPLATKVPAKPSIRAKVDDFVFRTRVQLANPIGEMLFGQAFFPELAHVVVTELQHGLPAELATVVLNREIALVGGSGEFFCQHSRRLKERCNLPHTLFFGYCNGYSMYFPTIEAAAEGGYGADSQVSPVELGAGELMMNRALINIYTMLGKF